jgi:hypothetical protein
MAKKLAKEKLTQAKFAQVMEISQPAVAKLVKKGVLQPPPELGRWLVAYGKHMAKIASGRMPADPEAQFDLVGERARLAARQAERVELQNARERAELLPLDTVGDILGFHNSTIRSRTLGIPNALKAKHPELSTPIFLSLKQIVTDVLTELGNVRFPIDLDGRIKRHFRNLYAAAQSDGDRVGG